MIQAVIVVKTYKDSERLIGPFKAINQLFPDDYPMEVTEKEYASINEAREANPGKSVMTSAEYNSTYADLKVQHADLLTLRALKEEELSLLIEESLS